MAVATYLIVNFDSADAAAFAAYVPAVLPLLARHGGTVLVADYAATALEGTAHDVNVVIEFAREQDALAFYHDADYAPAKALRHNSTRNSTLLLAQGMNPAA